MSNEPKSAAPGQTIPTAAAASLAAKASGARPNKHDELRLLVNSRHPIITVETPEEERVEQLLFDIANELSVPLYTWSVTTGLAKMRGAPIYNSDNPEQALANLALIQGDAIFLLKDFARYCDNDRVCRRLRELAEKFRAERRSIVIIAASLQLPPDLRADSVPFQLGLPGAEELLPGVKSVLAEVNRAQQIPTALDVAGIGQLAQNLVGLPQEEAMRALRMSILARRRVDTGLLDAVLDAKRDALRSDGLLETVRRDASFADVAGLKRLREWIAKRKSALTPEGRRFGLEPPKGILITGVQGCGKSLAARCRGAVRQIYRRKREEIAESAGAGAEAGAHGAVDRRNREGVCFRGQQRRRRCGIVAALAGHAADLDAGPRGRRVSRGDLQQHHRAAARDAAQRTLR